MIGDIRYAKSGDVSIAFRVAGDGPVELVYVPGFVGHLEIAFELPLVRRFFERLTRFARVLLYDKREQGLSDRLGRPPTLEESMDDLHAVIEAAGFTRPAIFGISEGGPMAILFAASHPDRVSHLVLYGTYARILRGEDYRVGPVTEERFNRLLEIVESTWGGPAAIEFWAPSLKDDEQFRAWWSHLLRSGTSPSGARDLMSLYRELDVRHALPAIETPTLVLQRADDRVTPAEFGRYLADHIPRARYVEVPGEDHLYFTQTPDRIAEEIEEFVTGTRTLTEPERRLATVVFTDIVSSTKRAAELGDSAWRELIEDHDAMVRGELGRYGGREIKTMGDGFLASFDGPARAIRCAQAVVEGAGKLGIEVRAGVHTGECEVMGDDLGGLAVSIGARVGALAGPAEVLVSQTVKDLVVGSRIEFEDRGTRALKGVPGEWRLFAARPAAAGSLV